jgi:oligoendopeptidase F
MLEVHRTNKQMKKVIYDNLIHTFFATTTSQIIFSDFEYNANR